MKLGKRKINKRKLINGTRGVISLFLCLVMSPVLMVASALIEFSRYQNVESVFQEVMDASSMSTMANYDEYIQKRFGLYTISQDCNINETYSTSLRNNAGIIEGVNVGGGITAKGVLPLYGTDEYVLKRQVLDFSEGTVLAEVILEDLNLQDLLDELDKLMAIGSLLDTLEKMQNMTSKVKALVEAGDAFVKNIESAVDQVEKVKQSANDFTGAVVAFYEKLTEDEVEVADTPEETETETLESIVSSYFPLIESIYTTAETLVTDVTDLKNFVTDIPEQFNSMKTAYDEAVSAVTAVKNSFSSTAEASKTGSAGEGEESIDDVSDEATSLYDVLLREIGDAIDKAGDKFAQETVDNLRNAADELGKNLIKEFGLDVGKRLRLTEYYSLPLSDEAKKDIFSIVKLVLDRASAEELKNKLVELFIPKVFTMDLREIRDIVRDEITDAKKTFENNLKESVGEMLTNLVNTIEGLFNLEGFYDGSLNAYLDDATIGTLLSSNGYRGNEQNNPYVNLLNALASMTEAVETFVEGLAGWDIFAALTGIWDLIDAIKSTVEAVINLTAQTVRKIGELVGWVKDGEWEEFGYLLLTSGYMTHNLPNRTNVDQSSVSIDTGIEFKTHLNGTALTGFNYSDIMTPSKVFQGGMEKKDGESSLNSLVDFLKDNNEGGTDKMFRGAELEYIMVGTASEVMNQTVVFMQIYFLRLLLDLVPIFTDPAVATMAASATIACWAVYLILVFAEPLCDTILLVNGSDKVHFIKRSCYLTPTGADNLVSALGEVVTTNDAVNDAFVNSLKGKFGTKTTDFLDGLFPCGYDTHCLLILMFTTTSEDMLRRLANIIQLETNYRCIQTGASYRFDITKAYTGIESTVEVEFDSFIKIFQSNSSSSIIKKKFKNTLTY